MTGIVEVQLPMDCKMRNIEETERAKRAILEREREGARETHSRRRPRTGGRPEASRTTAFDSTGRCSRRRSGRVAVRGETRRHARGGGREMTNGETRDERRRRARRTPEERAAAEVASDDLVFRRGG